MRMRRDGEGLTRETKTWEKSVSHQDFKFILSDVNCISGRMTLVILYQWKWIICRRVAVSLHAVFISVHLNSDKACFAVPWAKIWAHWQVAFSLQYHDWEDRGSEFVLQHFKKKTSVLFTYTSESVFLVESYVCVWVNVRVDKCLCLSATNKCKQEHCIGVGEATMVPWRFHLMEIWCRIWSYGTCWGSKV